MKFLPPLALATCLLCAGSLATASNYLDYSSNYPDARTNDNSVPQPNYHTQSQLQSHSQSSSHVQLQTTEATKPKPINRKKTTKTNTRHYGKHLCPKQGYDCIRVNRGDTWRKLFPDARVRDIVMRLNRTNIGLHNRPWIVVPSNLDNIDLMDVSPFPDHIENTGQRTIVVSIKKQAFGAYNKHGYLVHWGPISSAKGICRDVPGGKCETITGTFKMIRKDGPRCYSKKFPVGRGGSPMPYCMFFYRGFAMHGSTLPGYAASHGCVRLFFEDAEWLNKGFIRTGAHGTRVIVTKS